MSNHVFPSVSESRAAKHADCEAETNLRSYPRINRLEYPAYLNVMDHVGYGHAGGRMRIGDK